MNSLGNIFMIEWAGLGLQIENTIETQESLTVYVSVPETSYRLDVNNEQMAGLKLAKRFKEVMTDMGVKRLTVKYKIRYNEHWTKAMEDEAILNMRKCMYKSQY